MIHINRTRLQDPKHVAIIMDGNGRWALSRDLPRIEGHRQGVMALQRLLEFLPQTGVEYLTVYAFSSENWSRPKEETQFLMYLLESYLEKNLNKLLENNTRLHAIGDINGLPIRVREVLRRAIQETRGCTARHLILGLNYGSRGEIVEAAKKFAQDYADGNVQLDTTDWLFFRNYLDTKDFPDPDFLIRTSGEERLSNFLLLQCAYAEFYTTPLFWPDFQPENFSEALQVYQERERRYGGLNALVYNPLM